MEYQQLADCLEAERERERKEEEREEKRRKEDQDFSLKLTKLCIYITTTLQSVEIINAAVNL